MQISQLLSLLMKLIQLLQIEKRQMVKLKEELLLSFLLSWMVLRVEDKLYALVLLTDQTVLTPLSDVLVDLIEKLISAYQMRQVDLKLWLFILKT